MSSFCSRTIWRAGRHVSCRASRSRYRNRCRSKQVRNRKLDRSRCFRIRKRVRSSYCKVIRNRKLVRSKLFRNRKRVRSSFRKAIRSRKLVRSSYRSSCCSHRTTWLTSHLSFCRNRYRSKRVRNRKLAHSCFRSRKRVRSSYCRAIRIRMLVRSTWIRNRKLVRSKRCKAIRNRMLVHSSCRKGIHNHKLVRSIRCHSKCCHIRNLLNQASGPTGRSQKIGTKGWYPKLMHRRGWYASWSHVSYVRTFLECRATSVSTVPRGHRSGSADEAAAGPNLNGRRANLEVVCEGHTTSQTSYSWLIPAIVCETFVPHYDRLGTVENLIRSALPVYLYRAATMIQFTANYITWRDNQRIGQFCHLA